MWISKKKFNELSEPVRQYCPNHCSTPCDCVKVDRLESYDERENKGDNEHETKKSN